MGIYGYVMTEAGETRSLENGKPIVVFQTALWNYCHSVEHGKPLSEYDDWFQHLEITGTETLCAISQAFRRSIWHDQAIYREDEYDRFAEFMSQNPDYTPEDYSHRAFLEMLEQYKAAYVPVEDLIADVRRIVERIKQVNPPEGPGTYYAGFTLADLEDLLAVLIQAKADGAKKACLMMG